MSDTPQGPGWWQASDGKWYPPEQQPPPAPETPGAPPGGAAAATGRIDIGQSISYGWESFKKYPGPLIGAFVVVAIGSGILYGIAYATLDTSTVLFVLLYIAAFIAALVLAKGLLTIALDVTQGREPDLGKLFSGEQLGPYIVASVVVAILTGIGYVLCVIPGLFAAVALQFTPYRVIDRAEQPGDAIRGSWELVKPQFWPLVGLIIVAGLINFVGALLCGIGLLVTGPLTAIAFAHAYRTASGQQVVPAT